MRARFTQSLKIQAVEKVLGRSYGTRVKDVAETLGAGQSTLQKWMVKSRNRAFESISSEVVMSVGGMGKEKRPQDCSPEEKLAMVIRCGGLSEEDANKLCREQGLYTHHIQAWKEEFNPEKQEVDKAA